MKTTDVFMLLIAAVLLAGITNICQNSRLSDLEARMTTVETVHIEVVAPPEGVSP